jgi:hypothetical protein
MSATTEPTIEWEGESLHPPDPLADQILYFKKWELIRQQRIIEARENSLGLSIYELSRRS